MTICRTRSFLGPSHPATFATSTATLYSFQSIIGGKYPGQPGLDAGESVVNIFADAEIPTFGYQSNSFLTERYGYAQGFTKYDEPEQASGLKDFLASHITLGSWPYKVLSTAYNAFQSTSSSLGGGASREYRSAGDLIDDAITDVEALGDPAENDWFVWIHLMEPHHPYNPSPEFTDISRTKAQGLSRKALAGNVTPEEEERLRELYAGEVTETDAELKRLWDWTPDDARVVFCADHGELLGDDGLGWGHFQMFGPRLLRVPFATRNAPELTGSVASLIDVPTVLSGREFAEGQFNRDLAFAASGGHSAATDGRAIASDEETYWLTEDRDEDTLSRLDRERSRFEAQLENRDLDGEVDMEDLRDLGYA